MAEPRSFLLMPRSATLEKWGITTEEYAAMAANGCSGCGAHGKTRALAVDHQHVRGFKEMPPEEKRKHIRGVLCWTCNSMRLVRGSSPTRMRKLADYLENSPAQRILRMLKETA